MTSTTLIINEQHIALRESVDVPSLAEEILRAVREGGDFVHIEGEHGVQLEVLVTPHTKATIRQAHSSRVFEPSENTWAQSLELDF